MEFIYGMETIADDKARTPKQKRFDAYRTFGKPWGFVQLSVDWYFAAVGKRTDLSVCVKHAILTAFPDSSSWAVDSRTGFSLGIWKV
jgi:hypothetical protein